MLLCRIFFFPLSRDFPPGLTALNLSAHTFLISPDLFSLPNTIAYLRQKNNNNKQMTKKPKYPSFFFFTSSEGDIVQALPTSLWHSSSLCMLTASYCKTMLNVAGGTNQECQGVNDPENSSGPLSGR